MPQADANETLKQESAPQADANAGLKQESAPQAEGNAGSEQESGLEAGGNARMGLDDAVRFEEGAGLSRKGVMTGAGDR